jgi:cytoskeletal protein CcmA (bactofilin family)
MLTIGALALAAVVPLAAGAFQGTPTVRDKFRSGGEVTVRADETVPHDLYVSGGRVRIDGRVDGDLIVAGGDVDLGGPVQGDLMVAGGTVTIRSTVEGDVRAAGGEVRIEGPVREDALVTAGTFTLTEGGRVGEDLVFGAGQVNLDGAVTGDVLGNTGDFRRSGTVGGATDVTENTDEDPSFLDRLEGAARRYVSIVLIGVLALALAPRALRATAATLRERPLPSAAVGIATVIGFGLALILLLIVIVLLAIVFGFLGFGGLALTSIAGLLLGGGVLIYLFGVTAAYVAAVVVGLMLGRLALPQARDDARTWAFGALLLGVLAIVVLGALPVVGFLVNVIVLLLGLGAIALALWQRNRRPVDRTAAA